MLFLLNVTESFLLYYFIINDYLYLQKYFEPILNFDPCRLSILHGSKRNLAKFDKEQYFRNQRSHTHHLVSMHFTSTSTCTKFMGRFYSCPPWTIVHGPKGKFGQIQKWAKSPKPKRPCPPKCKSHYPLLAWIFWADSISWPPWTIIFMVQKEIWPKF